MTALQLDLFATPAPTTAPVATPVQVAETVTWVARGTTDDVTTCEHCGKEDLKGTVRMVALDADGGEDGEQYMGVVCAARMTGRKSTEIRTEAARADRAHADAVRAAHRAWFDARSDDFCARRDAALGRGARPLDVLAWSNLPEQRAAQDAWDAAHPAPEMPAGY
jgi:hypothetical protein